MALLTIVAADVAPIDVIDQFTAPTGEALNAGYYARVNTSTGVMALGNASSAGEVGNIRGIALNTVAANETTTFIVQGYLSLGDAMDGMSYGDPVYLSDTDGRLADAAGTVTTAIVGYVAPGFGSATPDKILWVNL